MPKLLHWSINRISEETMTSIGNPVLEQIIAKSRQAQRQDSPSTLSTGEAVAAALVLNRPDWLANMDYTLAQAIGRMEAEWLDMIPAAASQLQERTEREAYAEAERLRQEKLAKIREQRGAGEEIDLSAKLVTVGNAPGYRDVTVDLDLTPIGETDAPPFRTSIRIKPQDGLMIAEHILDVHRFAWRREQPLDAQPGEKKPAWVDAPMPRL
jgi:hypothetical protein